MERVVTHYFCVSFALTDWRQRWCRRARNCDWRLH